MSGANAYLCRTRRRDPKPRSSTRRPGAATALFAAALALATLARAQELPGRIVTSWIGNTFEGAGPNGRGRWVQNNIDEIEVTPEGAVITCSAWDEAGRCTGIYKDGDVNTELLKQYDGRGGHNAWGWGTASAAVAADKSHVYLVNTDGDLLRFKWSPANIHASEYVDRTPVGKTVGLTVRDGKVYVIGETGEIQVRETSDLATKKGSFTVEGAKDLAVDAKGDLWVLAGGQIRQYSAGGAELAGVIDDVEKPTAVSVDDRGRLVVCEDGPRQQVLFYDISRRPRLVGTFGQKGGLRSGRPGEVKPLKLFALKGAGTDAQGNIYVALSRRGSIIRKFTPAGRLVWEMVSTAFLDAYEADAKTGGRLVYGVDEVFEMNLSETTPGKEWRLKAITLDTVKYPDDPRLGDHHHTARIRHLEGRRVLFTIGMWAGGYRVYTFESPTSYVARFACEVVIKGGGWAWDVDSRGDVWQGEGPNGTVRRFRFKGLDRDGRPTYDTTEPEATPWPAPFDRVQRVRYLAEDDVMYVSGYTPGKGEKAWGLVGSVLARYDDWDKGNRAPRYQIDMPVDDTGIHPKSFDVAGDYVFAVAVKSTQGKPAMVHVYGAGDGRKVGTMVPGPEVGGGSGWVDIPYGISAYRRPDGEYLVIVEEDWRAKNLLYRWRPGRAR